MLTRKQLTVLALIALIPFIAYLFRGTLIGADGYYFAFQSCIQEPVNAMPLAQAIFSVVPCNEVLIKVILFGLMFASSIAIALMGSVLHKERGWMAGALVYLSPLFVNFFLELEDDQFAFPLLFLALYFMFKGKEYKWVSLGLIGVSVFIWKGSIIYLFALALNFIPATILTAILLWNAWPQVLESLMGNYVVSENKPLLGMAFLLYLIIGFAGIQKKFVLPLALFFVLALVNSKFTLHLLPFLAVGLVFFGDWFKKKAIQRDGLMQGTNKTKEYESFIHWILIMVVLATSINLFFVPPTHSDLLAVNKAIELSGGQVIQNDWDYGYWIQYYGGKPSEMGGGGLVQDFNETGIVLTRQDLNCEVAASFEKWSLKAIAFNLVGWDKPKTIKVFDCGSDS